MHFLYYLAVSCVEKIIIVRQVNGYCVHVFVASVCVREREREHICSCDVTSFAARLPSTSCSPSLLALHADCETMRNWLTKCQDDSETAHYIAVNTKDVNIGMALMCFQLVRQCVCV